MNLFVQIDILVFSFMLLLFLLVYYRKNASVKDQSGRLFINVVVFTMLNCLLAALAWVPDGRNFPYARHMVFWIDTLFLSMNVLPTVAWISYFDYKIIGDIEGTLKRRRYYMIPFFISLALMVINYFTGIVFTVGADNTYIRGYGVYILTVLMFGLPFVAFVLSRRYKERINGSVMQTIGYFMLLPVIAAVLQLAFFGTELIWPSMALVTLIAFVMLEKDALLKDSLTQLDPRGQLEMRIKYNLSKKKPFTLIMIDLDRFKYINDNFGHDEGDDALIIVASVLEESVKHRDMVCRYGGDEFMVLAESDDEKTGGLVTKRMRMLLELFNESRVKPYPIEMSAGSAFIKSGTTEGIKEILAIVDERMYADKEAKKRLRTNDKKG